MKYPFLVIACLAVFSTACNQSHPEPDGNAAIAADTPKTSSPYFPVTAFLQNEIDYVDSLPVGIMMFTTENNKTDSSYIKTEEFHKLAAEFLSPELEDTTFRKLFKETSLFDRNSGNASFLYTPHNAGGSVKRVDVVTKKGDVYDEVKSIYMEKSVTEGDKEITRKMYWKPKRNFQLISLLQDDSGAGRNEIIKVVWDNRE